MRTRRRHRRRQRSRRMEKVKAKIEDEYSTDLRREEEEEDQPYECGICLDDDIRAFDVVVKPCKCATSYCKKCWNRSMCTAPRCPTCRTSIGFDYDSEKGEAKFLLYEDPQSVRDGMIVLPEGYKPGTEFRAPMRKYFWNTMSQRVRPTFLQMLAETNTGEEGARTCVCGGKNCFRRMTMEERRGQAWNPRGFAPFCDACGKRQYEVGQDGHPRVDDKGYTILIGTHTWSCEWRSVAHLWGIDVCEDCMSQEPASGFSKDVVQPP